MLPGKIPGSSGTRNLQDNISDLRAQVAANHKVKKLFLFKYLFIKLKFLYYLISFNLYFKLNYTQILMLFF